MQDLIPLYPVYALLFADAGLSAAEISTLFVIWSVTGFVLEVPSGALADTISRRVVLALSSVTAAAGFALWVIAPSYLAFAAGFVLWGISGSLASGTFEATAYDALAEHDATAAYPRLMGLAQASALGSNLAATVLAIPLMSLGGFALTGVVSATVCIAQGVVALTLPNVRGEGGPPDDEADAADADDADDDRGSEPKTPSRYVAMLRAGLTEVGRSRVLRDAVVLVAVLFGFLAFDEYFPLLGREIGAGVDLLPLLIGFTVAAQAVGGLLAGRFATWSGTALGRLTAASAALIAAGALWAEPVGFVPIGIGYGLLQAILIVAEARMQSVITGPARATATSVAGLLSEVFAVAIFVGFAVGSVWLSMVVLIAALTVPVLATAVLLPRWIPPPPAVR